MLKAERNLAWVTDLLPVDEGFFFFEEKQPADIWLSHKLEISFPVSLVPLLQKPWERDLSRNACSTENDKNSIKSSNPQS